MASGRLPDDFFDELIKAGGEVLYFNQLDDVNSLGFGVRTHRKYIVTDGIEMVTGGFNIDDKYYTDQGHTGWRDIGIHIYGPMAGQMQKAFMQMWMRIVDERNAPRTHYGGQAVTRYADLMLTTPGQPQWWESQWFTAFSLTRGPVYLMSAYTIPTPAFLTGMARLRNKGIRPVIIVPRMSDVPAAFMAAYIQLRDLFHSGAIVMEYHTGFLHAKMAVIGNEAFVGSANFDFRSAMFNYDMMVRIRDPDVVRVGLLIFRNIIAVSRPLAFSAGRMYEALCSPMRAIFSFWDPVITLNLMERAKERMRREQPVEEFEFTAPLNRVKAVILRRKRIQRRPYYPLFKKPHWIPRLL